MPIFDYSCQACGHTFDVLQKLGADVLTDCPECGKAELKKLVSAPAFHLKGKGWRNSDDAPKKMDVRPKFTHTFDQAVPHAEHGSDGAGHSHAHDKTHDHGHAVPEAPKGGIGKLAHAHVQGHSHDHGHSHAPAKDSKKDAKKKSGGHSHGHSHGHKHDH